MKHFGRSLLNPTFATAQRDFSVGPLREQGASGSQPVYTDDASSDDGVMRAAFRKARATRGNTAADAARTQAGRRRA